MNQKNAYDVTTTLERKFFKAFLLKLVRRMYESEGVDKDELLKGITTFVNLFSDEYVHEWEIELLINYSTIPSPVDVSASIYKAAFPTRI